MPSFNAGLYIADAVRSVLAQSYQNWELIIVDDGSTDDTALVLEAFRDPRIRIHRQENSGQCSAANKAFNLSKGKLIKFMDADDMISPDCISEQAGRIGERNDVIASAAWGRFYENDLRTFELNTNIIRQDSRPIDWLVSSMDGKQVMLQCAIWLVPRAVLERSGLWDERLSLINDFEFIIRVLLHAQEIRFAEKPVLYYRSGLTGSLSSLRSQKGARSAYDSILMGTAHLLAYEKSDRVRKICAACFQHFIYSFYPYHRELVEQAEIRIKELGGTDTPFPSGGYTRLLQTILGWKNVKKLKLFLSGGYR